MGVVSPNAPFESAAGWPHSEWVVC